MTFMRQQLVLPSGVGIFKYSGLSSTIFKDRLYVFYSGASNDGVWYAILDQKSQHWSGPFSCLASGAAGMGIAEYTSPCSVVYDGSLYLFYNGAGEDGTYWTKTSDGTAWTTVASVSQSMQKRDETFGSYTSPSAAVYENDLYLFWNNSRSDGLRYSYLSNGSSSFAYPMDVTAPYIGLRRQTSSAAVTFGNSLYLFYNGSGHDGTWVATLTHGVWSPVSPVSNPVGGNYLDYTSPAAYVSDDGRRLTLLWNGYDDNGIFYTTRQDSTHWETQTSLRSTIDGMGMLGRSSPTGVNHDGVPYMFWAGTDGKLWLSQGLTLSIDGRPDLNPILQAIQAGNDFTLTCNDAETVQDLLEGFGPGVNPLPGPALGADLLNSRMRILAQENWANIVKRFFGPVKPVVGASMVMLFSITTLAIHKKYDVTLKISQNGLHFSCIAPK